MLGGALEDYYQYDPGTVILQSGEFRVDPLTLDMREAVFNATGGTTKFGSLGVNAAVDVRLNTVSFGSGAKLRLSGTSATTHTIRANTINIASPDCLVFEGVSVDNAPSLELIGTLNGTVLKPNNGMMSVDSSGGQTYTANISGSFISFEDMATAAGLEPDVIAYYAELDARRDQIITNGLWTNPDILLMDDLFYAGQLPPQPPVPQGGDAPLSVNAIVSLTAMNDFGAMILQRQSNSFGLPRSALVDSALIRGQACDPCAPISCRNSRNYDLWFQGFHAGMNVWSRGRDGAHYSVARNGGVVGVSTALGRNSVGGFVLGLSNPYFWDDLEKVDLTDFQFGGHVGTQFGNNWEAGAYIGGGTQRGSVRRNLPVAGGGNYVFNGDYDGNTFSASFSLSKVYRIGKRSALRPTAALDTEHAWQFGFTERSDDIDGTEFNPNAALRRFEKNHYGRTMARLGVMAQTGGSHWGMNGRFFYAPQLGGKDYATSRVTLASGQSAGSIYDLDSLPLGRDMFAIGLGGHIFLDAKKTLHIYTDYNANLFKRATTQTVALGVQKAF